MDILSCQAYAPLVYSPQVPNEWASIDFTEAACAAPDCGDNRAAFETCCDGSIVSFDPSTSIDNTNSTSSFLNIRQDQVDSISEIPYLSCSINSDTSNWDPLSPEASPYLDYQNCLLREGSQNFKCNMPRGETGNDCPVGMPTAPTGEGEMTCSTRNLPNATAVLDTCCESEVQVYGYGCSAWCSGNSEMQECVDGRYGRQDGPGIFCVDSTTMASSTADSEEGTDADQEEDGNASGAVSSKKSFLICYAIAGLLATQLL